MLALKIALLVVLSSLGLELMRYIASAAEIRGSWMVESSDITARSRSLYVVLRSGLSWSTLDKSVAVLAVIS
ncbi:hypothetical protein BDV96DRAFT_270284 [Lophiotrema nucula]|uniref:Uncharacterized protein n=1 Tax=Lophiotrema nucula TaxID=690887 RepID=A0A6A5ZLS5_9PLEO|nr:hypothetical protein BDV96DRAFT_270284 [Lophiotrema nucula]